MARSPTTSDAFNAVAEPRRRQILDLLARGERPVNDVVASLGLAQPQVSKHLRVLREVGLRQRARLGASSGSTTERRAAQADPRLGPDVRAVLGPPARPDQGAGRAQGERAIRGTEQTRQGEMSMATNIAEQEIQTINILKEIEIAAPIEIAFEALLEETRPGRGNAGRQAVSDGDRAVAGRALVPRPGQQRRPLLGARAGHQAADAAGTVRADVHVVPGRQPRCSTG